MQNSPSGPDPGPAIRGHPAFPGERAGRETWHQAGETLKPITKLAPGFVLLVLLAVYGRVLVELVRDWIHDPNYVHGFLIAPISAYLIWQGRNELRRLPRAPSFLGLIGLSAAMALLILGTAGAEVFTQRVSLLLTLASLVLYLYGRRHLRGVLFPLVFLLFAIPLPYVIYYGLTAPMQAFAARVAVWGLNVVGVPSMAEGNIIHLPQASLEVAEACSGIRSLYAFLAVGALVAQSMPIPLWGRLLVFSLTIPLSVAGNAFRVFSSGLGSWLIGPEVTRGTPHELFGIVVFMVSLGIFVLIKKAVKGLWSPAPSSPSSFSDSPEPMPASSGTGRKPRSDFPSSREFPGS